MEQRSGFREFLRYTFLSVLGTLGVSCYILADTFFVSSGLGMNGLAALNLAIPVYNFINGLGLMFAMGGATRFCICKSQGRKDEASRIYANTIYMAALTAALFVLAGIFFSGRIAVILGADESVFEMTAIYIRGLLLFSPIFILNSVLLCFVRNDDDPQLAMTAMLTSNFSNIVLDYIFIFPLGWGITGAVAATGMSAAISIALILAKRTKRGGTFRFTPEKIQPYIIKQEVRLGFPSLVTEISSGIVMVTFNAIILSLAGNTGVAAYGVIANISIVVSAMFSGLAQGTQPLISRCHGRSDVKQVRQLLRYAVGTLLTMSLSLYLVILIFASPIAAIFNSEGVAELQEMAVAGLRIYFLSSAFTGYNILMTVFFTSVEKAPPAHTLSILRGFVLILPAVFLLSNAMGMTGVWLACPVTEISAAIAGFVMYRRYKMKA